MGAQMPMPLQRMRDPDHDASYDASHDPSYDLSYDAPKEERTFPGGAWIVS